MPLGSLAVPLSRSGSVTWTGHAVVGGNVAFTFAAAHDAYPVRSRLAIVADESHLPIPDDVIDTPVLQSLRAGPHLRAQYNFYHIRLSVKKV